MKKYITWVATLLLLVTAFVGLPSLLHAQGGPGGDPDAVPVDGGITILAAAGVAYGAKKIRDYRKKKQNEV